MDGHCGMHAILKSLLQSSVLQFTNSSTISDLRLSTGNSQRASQLNTQTQHLVFKEMMDAELNWQLSASLVCLKHELSDVNHAEIAKEGLGKS